MANRYLVATGDWSSTSIWSTTSGGSGGASVPTSSDSVTIDSGFTVTLNADATALYIYIRSGTINLSSYTLTTNFIGDDGTAAKTLNLASGQLVVGFNAYGSIGFSFKASRNSIIIPGTSLVTFNALNTTLSITIDGNNLNDLTINIKSNNSTSVSGTITGSPTFHSLIIQSKNSAAHTVNFDAGANITINDELMITGSSSNNIIIQSETSGAPFTFTKSGDLVDCDYISLKDSTATGGATWYAGSHSTDNGNNTGWIFTDPIYPPTLIGVSSLTGVQSLTFS